MICGDIHNEKDQISGLLLLLVVTFSAQASGNFRQPNGTVIAEGNRKSEVIALAGAPLYQDTETLAVDSGAGGNPVKREILTYRLEGSIGGMYLVVITIENNKVIAVESKQESRL